MTDGHRAWAKLRASVLVTHWKWAVVGVGVGINYAAPVLTQPQVAVLSRDMNISPALVGSTVCFALIGGVLGAQLFVPLAARVGYFRVLTTLTLGLAGLMLVGSWAGGIGTLLLVSFLTGLLAKGLAIAQAAANLSPGAQAGARAQAALILGVYVGLFAAKQAAALIVVESWRLAFVGQAVLLTAIAVPLLHPLRTLAPNRDRPRAAHPWPIVVRSVGLLFVGIGTAIVRLSDSPPGNGRARLRALRRSATPAMRMAFTNQATNTSFDTFVVVALVATGAGEASLWAVYLPLVLGGVWAINLHRLEGRRPLAHLLAAGPMALAWPCVAIALWLGATPAIWVMFGAAMFADFGSTTWTGRGPEEVSREHEDGVAAQKWFDSWKTAGMLAGISSAGAGLMLFGTPGMVGVGIAWGLLGAWEGLVRSPQVRARWRSLRRPFPPKLPATAAVRRHSAASIFW